MKKAVIYIHGKGGNAAEAEHFRPLFSDADVFGFDYHAETPWEAKTEFTAYFDGIRKAYNTVSVIANSIGAYFLRNMDGCETINTAYFISPVADMEALITDMMTWAGVSEEELKEKKTVETAFGETLSWDYLVYVRAHPLRWTVPTDILYGENDALISFSAVSAFAKKINAPLTVMPDGEHWFHTPEQMDFLDRWISAVRDAPK